MTFFSLPETVKTFEGYAQFTAEAIFRTRIMRVLQPIDKICEQCGNPFKAPTNGKLYCGRICSNKANYQRNKYRLADIRTAKKKIRSYSITEMCNILGINYEYFFSKSFRKEILNLRKKKANLVLEVNNSL